MGIIHQILIQHIIKFSFLLEKSIMDGVYVIFILVEHHLSFFFYFYILEELCFMVHTFKSKYLVFRNCSSPLLNGYSIYGLCLTFWTNEFLGSYSNYKFIISFSIFNRMGFWRILCSQSNIEEVFFVFHFQLPFLLCGFAVLHLFYLHFLSSNNPLRNSTNKDPIFPFHFSKRFLWSHSSSLSIFSSNSFRDLKIPFFPFIFQKDFFGLILALCLYFLQTHFGIF